MDEEADGPRFAVLQVPGELARLLGDPGVVGGDGAAGEVHAARAELDEKEYVQSLQEDRVHREEVTGDGVLPIVAEERAPGALAALGRGRQALLPQETLDRRREMRWPSLPNSPWSWP